MAKIRDLNPFSKCCKISKKMLANSLYCEYKNLLMNAVKINGLEYEEETFVKNNLIECGAVGYDKITKKWSNVYGEGLNELGNPTTLTLVFRNGTTLQRPASYDKDPTGAYRIMATPDGYPFGEIIAKTVEFMTTCNIAINQNVNAVKTPYVIVCDNEDLRLSLEHAIEEQQDGKAVIVVSKDIGESLKAVQTTTEYIADKLITIRDQERDQMLNKFGIMSANINKRERVQVGEVNATVGQCVDYIYLLIDTFNKQMDSYGIEGVKMAMNGSLEDIYLNEINETTEDNTVVEGGAND